MCGSVPYDEESSAKSGDRSDSDRLKEAGDCERGEYDDSSGGIVARVYVEALQSEVWGCARPWAASKLTTAEYRGGDGVRG